MTNAFTSLIRAALGAKGQRMCLNASKDESTRSEMVVLSAGCLAEIRGGDGVIESPKGSWTPTTGTTTA